MLLNYDLYLNWTTTFVGFYKIQSGAAVKDITDKITLVHSKENIAGKEPYATG